MDEVNDELAAVFGLCDPPEEAPSRAPAAAAAEDDVAEANAELAEVFGAPMAAAPAHVDEVDRARR